MLYNYNASYIAIHIIASQLYIISYTQLVIHKFLSLFFQQEICRLLPVEETKLQCQMVDILALVMKSDSHSYSYYNHASSS